MERREFLLASGTGLLGSTAITRSRQPVIGLNFDLSADINADPSTVDSVLVNFTNFELLPRYVNEDSDKASITITLDVENQDTVQYSTKQQLTNGQKVTKSDIDTIIPLVVDGIDTESSIDGEVRIDVDHPSVSDSYRQSFFISSDLVLDGLVGWWPLNELGGSTAQDISGNQNDGSLSGSITPRVWGRGGLTAYSFDGSDDYLDMGDVLDGPTLGDSMTVSLWVRPETDSMNQDLVQKNNAYRLMIDDPDSTPYTYEWFVGTSNFSNTIRGNTVTQDEWTHIVGVYSGSNMYLYENGTQTASASVSGGDMNSTSQNLWVGQDPFSQSRFLTGQATDVRIYDRALDHSEIQSLYEWGSGNYTRESLHDGTDSGAVSRYTFDGDVKDSWADNDGTNKTADGFTSAGIRGRAKSFDGSDDYVDTSANLLLSPVTVSAWIRPEDDSSNEEILASREGQSNAAYLRFFNGSFWFGTYDGTNDFKVSYEGEIEQWQHVVGLHNGEKYELYYNGALVDVNTETNFISNSEDDHIGRANDVDATNYNHYKGKLDDVRIYNRALSQSEVFELYQWGTRGKNLKQAIKNYQNT